jgi:hypothetical protein
MNLSMNSINKMMKGLLCPKSVIFCDVLNNKPIRKPARQLRQDSPSQYRHEYTSLELQKKALE